MPTVGSDYQLGDDQADPPILWMVPRPQSLTFTPTVTDGELDVAFGAGKSQKIKSFGHDDNLVHWLATRSGTDLHVDKSYERYTHHLIVRNDGMRIRGLTDDTDDQTRWHPPHDGRRHVLPRHPLATPRRKGPAARRQRRPWLQSPNRRRSTPAPPAR